MEMNTAEGVHTMSDRTTRETGARKYRAEDLREVGTRLFHAAGLPEERARVTAEVLVEGDLMGHTTHGLQLLPAYLEHLRTGVMEKDGDPEVLSDTGASILWDGRYLPGPWLMVQAIDIAMERMSRHPVVTGVIRRGHHIASLESYLLPVTEKGYLILIASSDPTMRTVAPFGGVEPVYTPNPLAAGIPTDGEPILMDISMSCTANGWVNRYHKEGKRLPGTWLLDNRGNPTDDPSAAFTDPPGTVLPLGGVDLGYKGFALGLLIEALTSALGGFGRADETTHWSSSLFFQIIDPGRFGGKDAFLRETGFLARACLDAKPRPGHEVRLPGSSAIARRNRQLREGVELHPLVVDGLRAQAGRLDVPMPDPVG